MFGSLPLELMLEVLDYLNTADLFVARRVSRKWFRILSSEDVCRLLLVRFFPCYFKSLVTTEETWAFKLRAHAERQNLIIRGWPRSIHALHVVEASPPIGHEMNNLVDYRQGKLLLTVEDGSIPHLVARIVCLRSASVMDFRNENREPFYLVRLSEDLLVSLSLRG